MKITKYASILTRDFSVILSSIIILTCIFLFIFPVKTISPSLLWQIILSSFITTLLNLIYYLEGRAGKLSLPNKIALHFMLVFILFISSASYYRWFKISNAALTVYFSLFIIAGYALVYILLYVFEYKQAELLNKKLDEYKHRSGIAERKHQE